MPSNRQRTTRARPKDPVLFTGEVYVYDDEALARDHPAMLPTVAILTHLIDCAPVLWINPNEVPASRYRLLELWARRRLGAGHRFEWLRPDDVRAMPGLFEVAS